MFGKKKKETGYVALAEQRRIEEQRLAVGRGLQAAAQSPSPAKPPEKVYLESEIIYEEPVLIPVEEWDTIEELRPVDEYELLKPLDVPGAEEVAADDLKTTHPASQNKSSKISKLPSFIDSMLTMNLSRPLRMNFAIALLKQYKKCEDDPERKAILGECIKKLIASLSQA